MPQTPVRRHRRATEAAGMWPLLLLPGHCCPAGVEPRGRAEAPSRCPGENRWYSLLPQQSGHDERWCAHASESLPIESLTVGETSDRPGVKHSAGGPRRLLCGQTSQPFVGNRVLSRQFSASMKSDLEGEGGKRHVSCPMQPA